MEDWSSAERDSSLFRDSLLENATLLGVTFCFAFIN